MDDRHISAGSEIGRRRIRVTGIVQGVGFRPFVYGLAKELALNGLVGNDSGGVFIEVEGLVDALDRFVMELEQKAPPLAHIAGIDTECIRPNGAASFVIVESEARQYANTLISPDVSVCQECLAETLDPADRRYRYPFTNCTNCGPRFTIIQDIPYDRPMTTMASFVMCPACQAEYDDPLNRRFHAQPNACPVCGPHVWLSGEAAANSGLEDPIQEAQRLLADGQIVAIKGLGGFHLASDSANTAALARLRERKGRVDKPFAVMALNIETVRLFAEVSSAEAELLSSRQRPILLLNKRAAGPLSELVAPGNKKIGVMLPYTPLHYLLLTDWPLDLPAIVLTSGNYSDEPIVKENDRALENLAGLADAFLLHNRHIEARADDSVVRMWREKELPIRRSRGYAPFPVRLPSSVPPILAVGGELKATFCLAQERYAYLSQHIGDMENLETVEAFETAVAHFRHIFRIAPRLVTCDLHPRYLSTRWALEQQSRLPVVQVQHHHAHIASLMAEHQVPLDEQVIGFSFDGTGYGTDGAIWGGEVMLADYGMYERVAHLEYMPLPGGDAAIKRPYRLALAYLWAAGLPWDENLPPVAACPAAEREVLRRQLETAVNVLPTSSMGRLFDVVSSLAGVRQTVTYEGQAAIELESLTVTQVRDAYDIAVDGSQIIIRPLLAQVVADVLSGENSGVIAARFHQAIANLILAVSQGQIVQQGNRQIALSGGVFQNVTLLERAVQKLEHAGLEVLVHHQVPPNDGGLALGQTMIASVRSEGETK